MSCRITNHSSAPLLLDPILDLILQVDPCQYRDTTAEDDRILYNYHGLKGVDLYRYQKRDQLSIILSWSKLLKLTILKGMYQFQRWYVKM